MEIAEPKTAISTKNAAPFIAWENKANFPMKPAVNGTPAMESIEIAAVVANKGSDFANPLKAPKEVSLFNFSTQIRHMNTPTVDNE